MHRLLNQAVRNNAFWCEAVLRARGISSRWEEEFWLAADRAPSYYPNLITLSKAADGRAAIAELSDSLAPGWGIKDSFGCLDLEDRGFQVVMSGSWYGRFESTTGSMDFPPGVQVVRDASELRQWLAGWAGGEPDGVPVFPPVLLASDAVAFIHYTVGDRSVAGLVANLSDDVMGISNLFGADEALAACVDRAVLYADGRAMVGYGDHEELALLEPMGFAALGPVRIWVRS